MEVIRLKRYQCPCCGFYTLESDSGHGPLFDYCEVCSWQYDPVAHNEPYTIKGANKITLSEAKDNFLKYGASKQKYIVSARKPLQEELPENN